ncbi:IpaD/SipD/SspD family type III secretion system needle tip protein [Providencia rettgeri]|uniref:IpaD/SipD/SspD family type III secretion system needle tip protein n=1 Tax=Providencia rettgeri TaxID=587 RepID=UPI000D6F0957|nr:IpaD/SipD/SspD family type III secretion system needle tip protein [Providencia rettgeri]MDM9283019.1 IpaD/SipD/SspD family type III secretion system needle tip protein [Providencia rettgeri]
MSTTSLNLLANIQLSRVNNVGLIDNNPSPIGEGVLIDPNLDIYQQVVSYYEQLCDEIAKPIERTNIVFDQLNDISEQANALIRELKISGDNTSRVLIKLSEEFATLPNGAAAYSSRSRSIEDGRSHIGQVEKIIKNINSGYQKDFGNIIKSSTKYMQDVNTALGKISEYIKAGDDGKIKFQRVKLLDRLDELFSDYTDHKNVRKKELGRNKPLTTDADDDNRDYYKNWSESDNSAEKIYEMDYSDSAFNFWKKKLGGQGFVVDTRTPKGKKVIRIYPDITPLKEIMTAIYDVEDTTNGWKTAGVELMAQTVQSLQTAIDAQKNAVNSSVSRLLETFRQDNSHFDTLTQLLIKLIQELNQYNSGLVNI